MSSQKKTGPEQEKPRKENTAGDKQDKDDQPSDSQKEEQRAKDRRFKKFTRWAPSHGSSPDGPTIEGKLVPGLRPSGEPPVPVITPDIPNMPFRMVDGWKEFHVYAERIRREFLPDFWLDVAGYNGTTPGQTIQVTVGEKVRIVLHNRLPEPTLLQFYGMPLPNRMGGVPGLNEDLVSPGGQRVYEFVPQQPGTFYYQSGILFQVGQGLVGFLFVHPKIAHDPPVDRDFALAFQLWRIEPLQTINDPWGFSGQFRTVNGRSAPYMTPIITKLGERVRIRVADLGRQVMHAIHNHGFTFWQTGYEAARQPLSNWLGRNTTLIHAGTTTEYELIANNPGDWVLHCHMVSHMMNLIPSANPIGPRERQEEFVQDYQKNLDTRPLVTARHHDPGFNVPGYPQHEAGWGYTKHQLEKLLSIREAQGMRPNWFEEFQGLFSVLRVMPASMFDLLMNTDKPIKPGEIFQAITEHKRPKRSLKGS